LHYFHGQYQDAALGQTIHTSDRVRTLHDSQTEITLIDSRTIFLTEDSEITIDRVARTSRALRQLRAEYTRITYVIRRINEAERRLRRVLFLFNRKYNELEEKLG
jgi:hypothetical protein